MGWEHGAEVSRQARDDTEGERVLRTTIGLLSATLYFPSPLTASASAGRAPYTRYRTAMQEISTHASRGSLPTSSASRAGVASEK